MISPGIYKRGVVCLLFIISLLGCRLFTLRAETTEEPPTDTLQIINTPIATPEGEGQFICPAAQKVHNSDELIDILLSLEWAPSGEYSVTPLNITEDIEFLEPVTLDLEGVQAPQRCLERPDCRQAVALDMSKWLEGVDCLEEESVLWMDSCKLAKFQPGEVLRFRVSMLDTHPGEWNYVPRIELIPACAVPCQQGEFRCSLDNTCWDSYDPYCRLCLGLSAERCACQSPQGDLPDGSDCQYWISGDVLFSGKCLSGLCSEN